MTQEEKYKEALLEARAVLEPCLKYSKGKVREALDSIDNELKRFENEDEVIRKELKEAFEAYDIESKWNGIPIRSIFAWLEKQKEPENTSASTMAPSCWEVEQKEQKPKAKAKSPLSPHELYDAKIEGIGQGRQDVLDHPEQFGLQKPAEWSEEDERMRNQLIYDVEYHKKEGLISARQNKATKALYNGIEKCYDEKIAWLKSLPERFNLQPKVEWSEEDEKTLDDAYCWLCEYAGSLMQKNYGKSFMLYGIAEKLKSLRPQYHGDVTMTEAYKMGLEAGKASSWKPSEHQMNILKAVKDYVGKGSGYWGEGLGSLIDDLEKL